MANKTFNQVKLNIKFSSSVTNTVDDGNATGWSNTNAKHAANLNDSATNGEDIAVSLAKIKNWYDNWHPVVWSGDASTVNGHTVNVNVPSDAVFTDTTYTFTNGTSTSGVGTFTVKPSNGNAQTVSIYMGTSGGAGSIVTLDSNGLIPSSQLPSYVDDTIEGYYDSTTDKFYTTSEKTTEIPGETGKIYVDLGTNNIYRWTGSTWANLTAASPTLVGVRDVVADTNGRLTISYNDGSASTTVTAYTHPTTAGNKHIPTGGTVGQLLVNSASGTAVWTSLSDITIPVNSIADYTGPTASATAVHGLVPADTTLTTETATTHYLRADGAWSSEPVIPDDILTLNVIAQS